MITFILLSVLFIALGMSLYLRTRISKPLLPTPLPEVEHWDIPSHRYPEPRPRLRAGALPTVSLSKLKHSYVQRETPKAAPVKSYDDLGNSLMVAGIYAAVNSYSPSGEVVSDSSPSWSAV